MPEPPRLPPPDLPPLRGSLARTALRLAALVLFAYLVHLAVDAVMTRTEAMPEGTGALVRIAVLTGVLAAYALLIAIPFVPGIEIGISLILMRGADIAGFVYLATVAGLALAYLAGRHMPYRWLRRVFLDLRLTAAARLVERVQPLSPQRRLELLRQALPSRFAALAIDYRYLLLAGLLNMPGSALIGGGGGICLVAGLTRLFTPQATLATIALAVLPFPLAIWIWGPDFLG